MTDEWGQVVLVTDGHKVDGMELQWSENRAYVYVRCECGTTFGDPWEFTDHIRRLVFGAMNCIPDQTTMAEAWANVMDGRRIGQGLNAARIGRDTTTSADWRSILDEYARLGGDR